MIPPRTLSIPLSTLRIVGNPSLGITSCLLVIGAQSADMSDDIHGLPTAQPMKPFGA
jgi:hypothetical protein